MAYDLEYEKEFCKRSDCEQNESGQYIYESTNKKSLVNLPYLLMEYKQYLLENKLISEK